MKKTTPHKPTRTRCLRVLFTCIGRRVELLSAFRRAGTDLGIDLQVHGADASRLSPALYHVDKAHIVPPLSDRRYIKTLVDLARKSKIELLVPLIDTELSLLASAVDRFAEVGCRALVSSPSVVQVCRDKIATYRALKAAGIDTPATWTWGEAVKRKRHRFPYFLKPRAGSAAMGNYRVNNREELQAFGKCVTDPIVQEFVDGEEHTLDVYTGFDGRPRCVVPRKRLEVRTGEVSKALVVKDPAIMAAGRSVAQMLAECCGVITVQCMVAKGPAKPGLPRRIRVIEINPRFGGGVPLAIHAGADFPKWILSELLGKKPRINPTGFRADIAMLRFDDSVFVPNASERVKAHPRECSK